MIDLLIPILVFLAVVMIGGGISVVLSAHRRSLKPRLSPISRDPSRPQTHDHTAVTRAAASIGRMLALGSISAHLKEQLAKTGYYATSAAATYLGAKLILLLLGIVATASLLLATDLSIVLKVYLTGMAAAILFFLPNLVLRLKRQRRRQDIRNHLPDAVELLEICVSSGMGLDSAWNAVSAEFRRVGPTLADEMALVNLEVQLGGTRTEAMRNMANRTGADELGALVALLLQTERFGTSISDALRVFATSSREARSARAEVTAEKMSVKLIFPLVLCIFPAMLIVIMGPAGMALYNLLIAG